MNRTEAYRRKVMNDLGWLGKYTWDSLTICDQICIDQKVDEMLENDKAKELMAEAAPFLAVPDCPRCGYPGDSVESGSTE